MKDSTHRGMWYAECRTIYEEAGLQPPPYLDEAQYWSDARRWGYSASLAVSQAISGFWERRALRKREKRLQKAKNMLSDHSDGAIAEKMRLKPSTIRLLRFRERKNHV